MEVKQKNVRFCFIDLFHTKDETEFYHALAKEVIKNTASKWEELIQTSKDFFQDDSPENFYGALIQ